MQTIIAAFRDSTTAQQALNYLNSRGLTDVEVMQGGTSDFSRFRKWNISDDRTRLYADAAQRGASVVVAHTDHDANEIARELDNLGSLDLDENLPQATPEPQGMRTSSAGADIAGRGIDVIEENVAVGKREVSRGGVRVRTFVAERPVEEQVQLTEERIDVRREPVNEPISPSAVDAALTEDEFTVTAQGEEVVVGKEARVVERVHVGKQAETRTETVQATERRRDVDVQPLGKSDTERRR